METVIEYPWIQDLKKGTLVAVSYGYGFTLGLFKAFREPCSSYVGCRLHYYEIPSQKHTWNPLDRRIENLKKDSLNIWVSYINARAEDRVIPIDEKHLTPKQLEYVNLIREVI